MVLQKPTVLLIWVRVGNCRRVFLLDLFRQVWPRIMDQSQPYPDMPTQMEQSNHSVPQRPSVNKQIKDCIGTRQFQTS
jgi:hypothetical protein